MALAILSVLFVTIAVVFTLVLLQPSRGRPRSGCARSVQGTGRPVPAAFERLQTAAERCQDAGDDGEMLVVVGREDELHVDAIKAGSDDESV